LHSSKNSCGWMMGVQRHEKPTGNFSRRGIKRVNYPINENQHDVKGNSLPDPVFCEIEPNFKVGLGSVTELKTGERDVRHSKFRGEEQFHEFEINRKNGKNWRRMFSK
jgi:hypothetical protein